MGFSIFYSVSSLLKFVFLFKKMHELFDFKTPFKIKVIEKPHTVLLPNVWFLSCNKKFYNSMISAWVGALQNWPGYNFLNPENRSSENVSIVNFKQIFDILLLNNLINSFLNLLISLTEVKTLLNQLFVCYLNLFISFIKLKNIP